MKIEKIKNWLENKDKHFEIVNEYPPNKYGHVDIFMVKRIKDGKSFNINMKVNLESESVLITSFDYDRIHFAARSIDGKNGAIEPYAKTYQCNEIIK